MTNLNVVEVFREMCLNVINAELLVVRYSVVDVEFLKEAKEHDI